MRHVVLKVIEEKRMRANPTLEALQMGFQYLAAAQK